MMAPYDDAYSDRYEEHGPIYEGVTRVLLTLSLAIWSCIWGGIWLLSGLYVALHFREDRRGAAPSAPDFREDDL